MDLKNKHIAITLNDNGECVSIANCKVVNEIEYKKLLNEQERHKNKEKVKQETLNDLFNNVVERLEKLEKKDFCLAKSIYDNFVDRGLIKDSDQFQQDFYDYIFNNKEIKVVETPNDFQAILRKVGNL